MQSRWQPAADQAAIKARARLLKAIRAFFDARDYLEVDTPVLASTTVTDPNIESIPADNGWLQTSPEFAMKRLLAADPEIGPIYQIAHAFRKEEAGRWHNPEFSLLEWYVPGYNHHELMKEVESLLRHVVPQHKWPDFPRLTYQQLFQDFCGLDPFSANLEFLQQYVAHRGIEFVGDATKTMNLDDWLDLIMGQLIGPRLGHDGPCFVIDYPPSQAALARIRDEGIPVASRFELYWQGLELANGFHELADAQEQRDRFEADLQIRATAGQSLPKLDEYLLCALEQGLPDCAGVALGLDRLLALILGRGDIQTVLSFPADRI
ncbi:MAG: EF-P lysine aminoacylase EpmA [Salinisphaeraceae bacterium]|nr:EF-P lysine aminoacylase EpmA [Salinisphaeraceae bacterium]